MGCATHRQKGSRRNLSFLRLPGAIASYFLVKVNPNPVVRMKSLSLVPAGGLVT
jgi:hypothetical protein